MRDGVDYSPFVGRGEAVVTPTTLIWRFSKPGGQIAEIRERFVAQFKASEWLLFVDDSLIETSLYHGVRESQYLPDLERRRVLLRNDGWTEMPPTERDDGRD